MALSGPAERFDASSSYPPRTPRHRHQQVRQPLTKEVAVNLHYHQQAKWPLRQMARMMLSY